MYKFELLRKIAKISIVTFQQLSDCESTQNGLDQKKVWVNFL